MTPSVFGYQNNVLTATLTGSTAATGLGVDQLQNDQGNSWSAWQTTGTGTTTLTLVAASGSKWGLFGLFRTNLSTLAACSVVVRNGGSTGTIVYSGSLSGLVKNFGQMIGYIPTADVTGDWCQFTITDSSNSDGFFNIPLVYAGPAFRLKVSPNYQSAVGRTSGNTRVVLRAGGVIGRTLWIKRLYDCSLDSIRTSEVDSLRDMETVGLKFGNVMFVPDPGSSAISREVVFGEFLPSGNLGYPYQAGDARSYRVTILERL